MAMKRIYFSCYLPYKINYTSKLQIEIMEFNRKNTNIIARWWWSVDRVSIISVILLMSIGAVLVTTASSAVANRIGIADSFYFTKRQIIFLITGLFLIIAISFVSQKSIRRIGMIGYSISLILLIAVLIFGDEAKGAKRWLDVFGFSLQPSEFMKPFLIITSAWILSLKEKYPKFPIYKSSFICYIIAVALIIKQPDFGMALTISLAWGVQLFATGIAWIWIIILFLAGIFGIICGYLFLPHVTERIDKFLNPEAGDTYQIDRSLEAFSQGGLYGKGPGEGVVKLSLPDAHTDFIFSVAGEELGILFCMIIIMLYMIVIIRSIARAMHEHDLFVIYAVIGLVSQFGIQALINMAVSVHLIPTKGMTLPLISYGGSSVIAISLLLGIVFALTKKKFGIVINRNYKKSHIYRNINI